MSYMQVMVTRLICHVVLLCSSQRRGSLRDSGGGGSGAAGAFTNHWLGVMCAS